jgi:Ca-activated chloride channel homolog
MSALFHSVLGRSMPVSLVLLAALAPACARHQEPVPHRASAAFSPGSRSDGQAPAGIAPIHEQAAADTHGAKPKQASVELSAAKLTSVAPARAALVKREAEAEAKDDAHLQTPGGPAPTFQTERYAHVAESAFVPVSSKPMSTFSVDVDTASYANVRRLLNEGQRVDPGAVRIEEMINYFTYDYREPDPQVPFSVTTEVSHAPWAPEHSLVLVGLQGRHVELGHLPARNLVFLVDVSGSMDSENKLPLLKQSFTKLLDTMGPRDRVALVVYAGASGVVLPSTPADDRSTIMAALDRLQAGGSTNGAAGIELAYQLAEQQATASGINRVILATDGDFNVGTTSESALVELIEAKRKSGVYLTVLGFGMGNYNDSTLERLADHGNGNYAYIDSLAEAQKVLVTEASGTLMTIAKDVKIQVEFNPATVGAYRLIGYENRSLADHEFNDDTKDAGEIGAGHRVTALYELLSPAQASKLTGVDALKYQRTQTVSKSAELMTVKLRYKQPKSERSELLSVSVANQPRPLSQSSENVRFASAVAAFGMYLRRSEFAGDTNPSAIYDLASGALGKDPNGHRAEFLSLVQAQGKRDGMMVAR